MYDPKQIQFFAFARVVVPSGDDSELIRKVPAFGQEPASFGVMNPERLAFEVEQIQAPVGGAADDTLIVSRKGDQKTQPADIVHDAGSVSVPYKSSTCPRDLIGQDGGRHRMFPAAP
jgi:hypothetical protein